MIKVKTAGILSSIQDLGRLGHRRSGIPLSGAMDQFMSKLANKLVGNKEHLAVLEITLVGPVLLFERNTTIAITGAGFTPTINNREVALNTRIVVRKGDVLRFGLASYGLRGYLAVRGGFSSEEIFESRSQYPGITEITSLRKGDVLEINTKEPLNSAVTTSVKVNQAHFTSKIITVFKGPEFDLLPKQLKDTIETLQLQVLQQSNRMAYLLSGLEAFSATEIISAPVQPGTVQLTPSGSCAVLMRDAQTTGGYARILQLTEDGINRLSQKRAGDEVQFKIVDLP